MTRAATIVALMLATGCDVSPPPSADGPRLVASSPSDGAVEVDRLAVMRVDLDRRIAPNSLAFDGVRVRSGERSVPLFVAIDVVSPGLLITPQRTLDPEVTYVIEIDALRDLDGHLGQDAEPISFHTGTTRDGTAAVTEATFDDVAPIFTARCALSSCHGADRPVLGLDLTSADSVRATAIDVPATETARPVNRTFSPGAPTLNGLAIVEPSTPARSYLVYKVLGDPHVVGSPMPPEGEGGEGALSSHEIEIIVSWIRGGAVLPGPS